MRFVLFYISVLLLLSSCSDKEKEPHKLILFRDIKALDNQDSVVKNVSPQKTKTLSKPTIHKASEPLITVTNKNIIQAEKQEIITNTTSPKKCTPGETGYKLPFISKAIHNKVSAKTPQVVEAKPAYSKERNPYSFKFFTRLQGLTHDDISCITQDSRGNLWIGSYFSGASKFDGENFTHYSEASGLVQNRVITIIEDRFENIWLGAVSGGISKYNGLYFTNFTTKEGLSSNNIERLFEDSKGNIWVGTYDNGVSVFDGKTFTHYTTENGLSNNTIYSITEDKHGNIWLGTNGGGVVKFDGKSFFHYTTEHGLSSNYVHDIIFDRNENMWIATDDGGVTKVLNSQNENNDIKLKYFTSTNGLSSNSILSITEDSKGNIWFGTRGEGLIKYDYSFFHYYSHNEGIINNIISAIFEEENGQVWIGTVGGGVAKFQGNLFTHFSQFEGLINSDIRSIAQDESGNLWFGSNGNGVFLYDGWTFTNYTSNEGLANNYIRSIYKSSDNKIWIGTSGGGVSIYDGEYFYNYTSEDGLCSDYIFTITEDAKGNMWLTTAGNGICKIILENGEPVLIKNFNTESGIVDNNVVDILQDKNDNIWIATSQKGISMYDGENIYNYSDNNFLISNDITGIFEDSRGNIWISHYGHGATIFNGHYFANISKTEGLINNYVFSVTEDSHGNIWLGTRHGLSVLSKNNYSKMLSFIEKGRPVDINIKEMFTFKNFNYEDGFLGIGCNPRAIFEDSSGKIWIGANELLTSIKPIKDISLKSKPRLQLTRLGLFNEYINWEVFQKNPDTVLLLNNGVKVKNVEYSSLHRWSNLPKDLSLQSDNNYLTFSFVGTASSQFGNNRYQYILEGLDNNWSSLIDRAEAHYAGLTHGSYTFRVRALSPDGTWSDEAKYTFYINPPWYLTWQAYLMYSILLVFLVSFFYILRKKQRQKKQDERIKSVLMEKEVEVARKSAEFKQNFLANMSHEIRTPLTGILGMAEIVNKTELNPEQKSHINTLIQSGQNLKEIIDLILDYSKIEAGKAKLKPKVFSFFKLLNNLELLYSPLCKNKGLDYETIISSKIPEYLMCDMSKVNQVISNFLSNAIKFTDTGGVIVKASIDEKITNSGVHKDKKIIGIKIEVKDTGKGFNTEMQEKLFEPFSQIDYGQTRSFEGTGLGLSICKELTKLLNGEIGVKSQPNKGSTFWFTFRAVEEEKPKEEETSMDNNKKPANSINILLVEDKPITQKVVKLMLNSLGHEVTLANNGQDCVEIYEHGKFDLVLMDIQMPVMDGITATKLLRENHRELPPIVGLSANAFEGDREKYIGLGLDEYLTKPVKEDDFVKLLNVLGLG